jgi:hypothetical protein
VATGALLGAVSSRGPAQLPLLSRTVALDAQDNRVLVQDPSRLRAGTRVLREVPSSAPVLARWDAFRAATDPWTTSVPTDLRDLAEGALADLWVLTDSLPGPVAGWSRNWRFLWPRDVAFCAVALARIGQAELASDHLAHLQDLQAADGWFEARYDLGTGRAPDERPRQVDGTGWMLWAAGEVVTALPDARDRLDPLITRSATTLRRATEDGTVLPPVSPDYREVSERSVSLGIMAPTLAGLRAAEDLTGTDPQSSGAFTSLLRHTFEPNGFSRYVRSGGSDSALTFFDATGSTGIIGRNHLQELRRDAARPAGGIAPGASWRDDGISWTPATSLLGLALSRQGDTDGTREVLDWIAGHRTDTGSIPEKVLSDGAPASVAPLAWSAANVLLTVDSLRR